MSFVKDTKELQAERKKRMQAFAEDLALEAYRYCVDEFPGFSRKETEAQATAIARNILDDACANWAKYLCEF